MEDKSTSSRGWPLSRRVAFAAFLLLSASYLIWAVVSSRGDRLLHGSLAATAGAAIGAVLIWLVIVTLFVMVGRLMRFRSPTGMWVAASLASLSLLAMNYSQWRQSLYYSKLEVAAQKLGEVQRRRLRLVAEEVANDVLARLQGLDSKTRDLIDSTKLVPTASAEQIGATVKKSDAILKQVRAAIAFVESVRTRLADRAEELGVRPDDATFFAIESYRELGCPEMLEMLQGAEPIYDAILIQFQVLDKERGRWSWDESSSAVVFDESVSESSIEKFQRGFDAATEARTKALPLADKAREYRIRYEQWLHRNLT